MIQRGELLWGRSRLGFDLNPDWFKDSEEKKFVKSLMAETPETLQELDSFLGIVPQVISKEAFRQNLNYAICAPRINELTFSLQAALACGDYDTIFEHLPELSDVPRSSKLRRLADIEEKSFSYQPFFPEWDRVFRGLLAEDLIVIFAVQKTGKSCTSAYLAYKALEKGYTVGYYPTELTIDMTVKYILGCALGLKGNEALIYFERNPEDFKELKQKYGQQLILPERHIFNWGEYEELYKYSDIVFMDNIISSLTQIGMEENENGVTNFTRKLSNLQKKFSKPSFIVTQEGVRLPSAKELEANPEMEKPGNNETRLSKAPSQEASLLLQIVKDGGGVSRKIIPRSDRFRGTDNLNSKFSVELDNKGRFKSIVDSDGINKALSIAEKAKAQKIVDEVGSTLPILNEA